jgi:hypothetical protein
MVVPVLAAFVVSRLVLVGIILAIHVIDPPWPMPTYASGPILGPLTGHDAIYYLGIAAEGYHLEPVRGPYTDWVFFPAFPLLTRLVSVLTMGDVAVAGVIVSNVALLAALAAITALILPAAGRAVARDTAWLVAFAPGAIAFGMAYSDSLMLAGSAGAVLAARRGHPWLVALLYALATLSRPPGILLGLPLLVLLWGDRRLPSSRLTALAAGPLALAGFALYQGAVLGDPLAFIHGQAAWNIPPISAEPPGGQSPSDDGWYILPMVALLITTLLAYTATLPGLWRSRIPRPEVLVAIVAFASVFVSGRLQSDARYLAAGWSFAWFLASRGVRVRTLALVLSGGGYVTYGLLNISQLLAP